MYSNYRMFCPKCRAEYIAGIKECPDCKVKLVRRLPDPEVLAKEPVFVEILRTSNPGDMALMKSLLDAENIAYYFLGENFNLIYAPIDCRLMVLEEDAGKAENAIKELDLNYSFVNRIGRRKSK